MAPRRRRSMRSSGHARIITTAARLPSAGRWAGPPPTCLTSRENRCHLVRWANSISAVPGWRAATSIARN
ncbi:hypothetical protein EJP617_C030 (plasmid) [Erwinia sp. Ejp617]|nr:hypothetical protein EJP617_C030 [Erwinia sp. Ejp617]